MTDFEGSALDRVLAIDDPPDLLIELSELGQPSGALTAPLDAFWWLAVLYRSVVNGGIRGYLTSAEGADFDKALESCRLVEARSTHS